MTQFITEVLPMLLVILVGWLLIRDLRRATSLRDMQQRLKFLEEGRFPSGRPVQVDFLVQGD